MSLSTIIVATNAQLLRRLDLRPADLTDDGPVTTELLRRHLADLDAHIAQLQVTRVSLASLAERARSLDHTDCTDPHRCHVIARGASQSS